MLGDTAISILHSAGVLALMAIVISLLGPARSGEGRGLGRSLTLGLVFGTTMSFVMIDPIVLPLDFVPGFTFDVRGGPALLAGVYGGPPAAAVAALMGAITRAAIGGAGAPLGIAGLALSALTGVLAGVWLERRNLRPTPVRLLALSLVGTMVVLPTFLARADWQAGLTLLGHVWWVMLAANVLGTLVLGILLEQDWRRRRLELELRESEARTRTAAEAKTRFLAAMSHEIRTPMNAVVGFVDLLRDSNLDSFQRRCTDQIRDAARGLLRIIDDILDYAKIDSGRITLDLEPTDVAALIESCQDMLMPQVENKGIACTLDLSDRLPTAVQLDPVRLRQVLLNVLGNAVKFTDTGRVSIAARYSASAEENAKEGDEEEHRRGELEIVVADTGIGMTPQELDRLFNPFAQGEHIGRGGTGLGLVISRMLVRAMGGDIVMESVKGSGTTVTIRIPITEPAGASAERGPARPDTSAPAAALRVLVAEDVSLNAEMLQATLEQAGHAVRVVHDGRKAIEALREENFDIVLMDVQMPLMNGLEATREIRAAGGLSAAVPIIALTAYASREGLRECLDAGMNDFLTKPLERAKLQEKLQRWGGGAAPGTDRHYARHDATKDRDVPADWPMFVRGSDPAAFRADSRGDRSSGDRVLGEGVDRVSELLVLLAGTDSGDRGAIRSTARSLVAAAGNVGFEALADRAHRLTIAATASDPDTLGALLEEVTEAGRRAIEGFRQGVGASTAHRTARASTGPDR